MIDSEVADNGWGIPEEVILHFEECFYRGKHGDRGKRHGSQPCLLKSS